LRLESWGWSDQPRLIPNPLIRGVLHVADSDLSSDPGALHLGEVHAKFLGLTLGGLRGVGLFLPAALGSILGLLGGLPRCVLRLLGRALGGILRPLRSLSGLVGDISRGVLGLPGRLTGGVLGALRDLAGLVGDLPCRVLGLLGGPSGGVLDTLHGLPGLDS
jgi:hypothetical protein